MTSCVLDWLACSFASYSNLPASPASFPHITNLLNPHFCEDVRMDFVVTGPLKWKNSFSHS